MVWLVLLGIWLVSCLIIIVYGCVKSKENAAVTGCLYYGEHKISPKEQSIFSVVIPRCAYALVVVACFAFIMSLFSCVERIRTPDAPMEVIESKITQIYALNDNSGVSGSFFLGSGRIENELVYAYVVEEDGFKTVKTMDASGVLIDDTGSMDSCIEVQTIRYKVTEEADEAYRFMWLYGLEYTDELRTIIHIPPGSITTEYKIDLG